MRRLSLVAILTFATATSAIAQSAGQPTYAVGDSWTSTIGEAQVIKVTDSGIVMVRPKGQCPTCSWVHDKDLTLVQILDAEGKPADPNRFGFLGVGFKFLDFPLEVKKTWKIDAYGLFRANNVRYVVDCTVSALEDVKTQPGSFKAYRIDRVWNIPDSHGKGPSWKDTIWYAPDVKGLINSRAPPGMRGSGNSCLTS